MSNRRAFTLLELLLATALSTLLMVGVLAVITRVGAAAHGTASASHVNDAIDAMIHLLREDIDHAFDVDASKPNELALSGVGALEGDDRHRTHRPVRIVYRFEQAGGRMWLVRRQTSLDVLSNRNVQRDLVCAEISRFTLTAVREGRPVDAATTARNRSVDTAPPPRVMPAVAGSVVAESPPPDPYESILVDGLMFYRKYAPAWASPSRNESDEPTAAIAGASNGVDDASRDANEQQPDAAQPGIVWRLLLWTDAEPGQPHDRLVAIQRSEGL